MRFYILTKKSKLPSRPQYPYATLKADNWDDYGYRTTYEAVIYTSQDISVDLGAMKILEIDQTSGSTPMPKSPFRSLGANYCSLGHGLEYYETLYKLGPALREAYLKALGDVAWDELRRAEFEDLEGYKVSLLRFSGAERLVEEAARFLRQIKKSLPSKRRGFAFNVKTQLGESGPPLVAKFSFTRRGQLPHRVNAIIGYNGTGKTRLLSNLAIIASEYGHHTKEAARTKSAGQFIETKPPVVRVVVVSYSAFDSFVIPDDDEAERVGYVYCGLRTNVHPIDGAPREPVYGLKSLQEIELDFMTALERIRHHDRMDVLREAMRPLLDDASFQRIGLTGLFGRYSGDDFADFFKTLSSGHKIVVKIIVELVAFLEGSEPTLVLVDEPETHLHPPLTAAFSRSLRECLDQLNGFAIVATHSPVVLQEMPARYVRVLRRIGERATLSRPDMETFGEAIGNITQHVFNLDDGATDWHETLRTLAQDNSLQEIEAQLGGKLGFVARSLVASERSDLDE